MSPPAKPPSHPMMNAIGGTSIHYWAQSWRLKPWDFKTRSETIKPLRRRRHSRRLDSRRLAPRLTTISSPSTTRSSTRSASPAKPEISRDVSIPNGNIYEGPRQREYPMPPLRGSEFSEHMAEAARKLGWKPFRAPAAINSQPYKGRPGCAYHGYCGTGGCHISAKNSTAVTTIPDAQKTKNLTDLRLRAGHSHCVGSRRPRHRSHLHQR